MCRGGGRIHPCEMRFFITFAMQIVRTVGLLFFQLDTTIIQGGTECLKLRFLIIFSKIENRILGSRK